MSNSYLRMHLKRQARVHAQAAVTSMLLAATPQAMPAAQPIHMQARAENAEPPCEQFRSGTHQTIVLPQASLGFDRLARLGKTLVVLDMENLNYATTETPLMPDYGRLMERLQAVATEVEAHAFKTNTEPGLEHLRRYLAAQGIAPHIRTVTHEMHGGVAKTVGNSDNELLLRVGFLLARQSYDTLIIGTGDGKLGDSVLQFLCQLPKPPRAYTFSVLGATSATLTTERSPLVNGNLYLGQDLMRERSLHGKTRKSA